MAVASIMNDEEATIASTIKSEDLKRTVDTTSIKFKYEDGRSVWQKLVFKPAYKDEYTGEILPEAHIKKGIIDELTSFCDKVLVGVPSSEAMADTDSKIIPVR